MVNIRIYSPIICEINWTDDGKADSIKAYTKYVLNELLKKARTRDHEMT